MLSLFTVKKILFFTGLGSVIVGPIVATSPVIKEFGWASSSISPLKADLASFVGDIDLYEGEKISSFLQNALLHREAQNGLVESFAQELGAQWFASQPSKWTAQRRRTWKKESEQQYEEAWERLQPKDAQRDFWDNYWGSKESMYSFLQKLRSYQFVKEFLSTFNKSDLRLNEADSQSKGDLSSKFVAKNKVLKESELLEKDNWDKIKFYPQKEDIRDEDAKKIIWGKYEFINWSFRRWFDQTLPVYFRKVSWDYKVDATTEELEKEYNFTALGDDKPSRASYAFPIFGEKSKEGFKAFVEGFKENNGDRSSDSRSGSVGTSNAGNSQTVNLEDSIETWKGDRPHTATLVQVFDLAQNDSPETLAATSYLLGKLVDNKGTGGSIGASSGSDRPNAGKGEINVLEKSKITKEEQLTPISIFLTSGTKEPDNGGGITIAENILNDQNKNIILSLLNLSSGKANQVHDVREVQESGTKNSNWIFFRDQKGVHAIALDGESYLKSNNSSGQKPQNNNLSERLFKWFKFRNLHSTLEDSIWANKKTILKTPEDWSAIFSNFLYSNFDSLFTKFYLEKGDDSYLFKKGLRKKEYFASFKEALNDLFKIRDQEDFGCKIFQLRKSIIEGYSSREWEIKGNSQPKVAKKEGLSAPFPYTINGGKESGEAQTDEKKDQLFPQQEAIFFELLSPENSDQARQTVKVSAGAGKVEKKLDVFLKLLKKYKESLKKLIESNDKVKIEVRSDGFDFSNSQRIFIRDPIFDHLLDKLLSQRELLNYLLKEKKILDSGFLSNNELLRIEKNETWNNLPWVKVIKPEEDIEISLKKTTVSPTTTSATANSQSSKWTTNIFNKTNPESKKQLYQLLNSFLKIHFFREELRRADNNYFNFQADFPELKKKTSETSVDKSMTIFSEDLFSVWVQSSAFNTASKTAFLDLIIGLHYLSKDKFSGLTETMKKQLQDKEKYHYLVFEKVTQTSESSSTNFEQGKINPFLPTPKNTEAQRSSPTYFKNRKDANSYIREGWKATGKLIKEGSSGGEKSTTDQKLMLESLHSEKENLPNKKPNLFNYKDIAKLIRFIDTISSLSEFEKLISQLDTSIPNKISPTLYKSEKIFIGNNKEKKLSLEEKKKMLIYQLIHIETTLHLSESWKEEEHKKIFELSLDESLKQISTNQNTKQGSTQATSSNPLTNLFNRARNDSSEIPFLQIGAYDFEDENSIVEFFNLLPDDLLAEFLMQQIDRPEVRGKAQNYFFDNTPKYKVHDLKFKNHIDKKYLD